MDKFSYMPIPTRDSGIHIQERAFFISADLGQANDYTAVSIIERITTGPGVLGFERRGEKAYHLRYIERPPRGTTYPDVVDRLVELYRSPQLKGHEKAVVIDLTGLGRPVYDLMKRAGFHSSLNAISITAGMDANYTNGHNNVPKRDLVTTLQVMIQNGTLQVADGVKEADALIEELINFQTKISDSGHDTYGGRSGVHDDIVLSVAMGAWLAGKRFARMGDDRWM